MTLQPPFEHFSHSGWDTFGIMMDHMRCTASTVISLSKFPRLLISNSDRLFETPEAYSTLRLLGLLLTFQVRLVTPSFNNVTITEKAK